MGKNRYVFFFVCLVLLFNSCTKKEKLSVSNEINEKALSINDIKSDPLSYAGVIKISGVASSFSEADKTFFTIMDTAELMACRNLYCGAFALPVKYIGNDPLPELADVVDITGNFVKTGTDYYFAVTQLDVKRNILKHLTNTVAPMGSTR